MNFYMRQGAQLTFEYTNYKGETSVRDLKFIHLAYDDQNTYHPNERWFAVCFDKDKQQDHWFPLSGIKIETLKWGPLRGNT